MQGKTGKAADRGTVLELRMDADTGFKRKITDMKRYKILRGVELKYSILPASFRSLIS